MPTVVIVGAQWGDEGKGKVVDLYAEHAEVVARFGGGPNAGHTLVVDGEALVTHLVPSGVVHPGTTCVLGDGMLVDPAGLLAEIAELQGRGLLQEAGALLISRRAHVILPYHRELDRAREQGPGAIGTTRKGVGPAWEAKVARRGVRMGDLLREERLRALVARNLAELGPELERLGGARFAVESVVAEALSHGQALAGYLADTGRFLWEASRAGRCVLLEGAQGTLLDVDHGTYPYVTSSSVVAGAAAAGSGIGPTVIDEVIGISKAYTTRVGAGPFPTELTGGVGDLLRRVGAEFGATTGRPRRTGWLDVAALRYAVRVNGLGQLALTKLDVLRGVDPVRLGVGYRLPGGDLDEVPLDADDFAAAEPVYEELEGFSEEVRGARKLTDLPPAARRLLDRIEELVGIPLCLVSVGPGRDDTVLLSEPFGPSGEGRGA